MTLQLDHIRVHDAMHQGILRCDADATLGEVAGIMATHRVHAVSITDGPSARPAGVVSDLDVVAAIASGEELSARQPVSANKRTAAMAVGLMPSCAAASSAAPSVR